MIYDSLLLNCGGGIINDADKAEQFDEIGALCIGIGGAGMDALCDLRSKVHQYLLPDNPGEPEARYNGIQFLGIDSDEYAFTRERGSRKLSTNEFFSIRLNYMDCISDHHFKEFIKDDPLMNWMEIDRINAIFAPQGAGGVRQMGRFLQMRKASELYHCLRNKCRFAAESRHTNEVDVYLFTGLSGGTGSGCYTDVCYLLRLIEQSTGLNIRIIGYFFLPDVITSRREISCSPSAVEYNNANGYEALKELDYLMDLPKVNDWFEQDYGHGIHVRTQQPPVDLCHLISAVNEDGRCVDYSSALSTVSTAVLTYLMKADGEHSVTMRGHMSNVNRGMALLPRFTDANIRYSVLGASVAEVPTTQFNTYLACGFFQKFRKAAYKPQNVVTQSDVDRMMEELRFKADLVWSGVIRNSPELQLPHYDRKELARMPICPYGRLPESWAMVGEDWRAECDGRMTVNVYNLTRPLDGYAFDKINGQSLIGRLFRALWNLSIDPEYGPYYAASVLCNRDYDLLSALGGEIEKAFQRAKSQWNQLEPRCKELVELNQILINRRGSRRSYDEFYQGAERLYRTFNTYDQCIQTVATLRKFRDQTQELYESFFRPLCEMLDNLMDTFMENKHFLDNIGCMAPAHNWQLLSLQDIKPRLDEEIAGLNENQIVTDFINKLLENHESWMRNDADEITTMIRKHMLDLFHDATCRSFQDYLFEKYADRVPAGNVAYLSEVIEREIFETVIRDSWPRVWCVPVYDVENLNRSYPHKSLTVPVECAAACNAADYLQDYDYVCAIRKSSIGNRFTALRSFSGLPLHAHQSIVNLKRYYDESSGTGIGVGLHLYAATGRGGANVDWRNLPDPCTAFVELNPFG